MTSTRTSRLRPTTSSASSTRLRRRMRRQPVPLVRQPEQQRSCCAHVHVESVRHHGRPDGVRHEGDVREQQRGLQEEAADRLGGRSTLRREISRLRGAGRSSPGATSPLYRCRGGTGTRGQVAVGGALLQDAHRRYRGGRRRTCPRQRRSRQTCEGDRDRRHGRADAPRGQADAARDRARRSSRLGKRRVCSLCGDGRVDRRARARRTAAATRETTRRRPRGTTEQTRSATARSAAARTTASALTNAHAAKITASVAAA
jgi:hypothetical protein